MTTFMGTASSERFHVVTVGWEARLIEGILDRVEARGQTRFTHLVMSPRDRGTKPRPVGAAPMLLLKDKRMVLPPADPELLASLEATGVPTIHNMIMGDRVVRHLAYEEALRYATLLAVRLRESFEQLRPSAVLGSFDSLHAGMALAVARCDGIPWFAMQFTPFPPGLSSFCTSSTPDTVVPVRRMPLDQVQALAEEVLTEFEQRRLVVPAYLSANNLLMVVRRLPKHVGTAAAALRRVLGGEFDRFTEYSVWKLSREYVRKRKNLVRLPHDWFLGEPPARPYVFIGLHMQPESTVDVWAPFYADQAHVIETLARAVPPTHRILVKLHKSDADNYSRAYLDRLRRIPAVELVSPFANTRAFIDRAALVAAIQGTIGLEAGLVGKPVIMFGDSPFLDLPSIVRAREPTELQAQIRGLLTATPPSRAAIMEGLVAYLGRYSPGCFFDWEVLPTEEQITELAAQFAALHHYVAAQAPRPPLRHVSA